MPVRMAVIFGPEIILGLFEWKGQSMASETPSSFPWRGSAAVLLALGLISCGLGIGRIVGQSGSISRLSDLARLILLTLSLAAFVCIAATLIRLVRRARPRPSPLDLRVAFALLTFGSLVFPAIVAPFSYVCGLIWWGFLAAFYSLWLEAGSRWSGRLALPGAYLLDLIVFNLALALVLLQAGLFAAGKLFPSSLLSVPGSADRLLERSRCTPGDLHFGFPCNSLGYSDDEPEAVEGMQVTVVGDSFTFGIVPHAQNFTSVAEVISGYRIDNYGVPGAGPPEYRIILREDGLSTDPDIVVAAVFIGNDIQDSHLRRARDRHPWFRFWLDADLNPLWSLSTRFRRIAAELQVGRQLATLGRAGGTTSGIESGQLAKEYPWTIDYRLEEPTYSWPTFLELERFLAKAICVPRATAPYPSFFEDLEALVAMSAPRAFAVLLIPDKFQVEDPLWKAIVSEAPERLDRDLPQKIIRPWLDARRIPSVDLLPVFRAQPIEDDGLRHLYHLQDTHLNARGNRIAGELLASLLEQVIKTRLTKVPKERLS